MQSQQPQPPRSGGGGFWAPKKPPRCVFCNIAAGTEPKQAVFENDRLVIFHDIDPAAHQHLLVIPKTHIRDINALSQDDLLLVQDMHLAGARALAELAPGVEHVLGYHVPPFTSVNHLHLHCFAMPFKLGRIFKYSLPLVWLSAEGLEKRLAAGNSSKRRDDDRFSVGGALPSRVPAGSDAGALVHPERHTFTPGSKFTTPGS